MPRGTPSGDALYRADPPFPVGTGTLDGPRSDAVRLPDQPEPGGSRDRPAARLQAPAPPVRDDAAAVAAGARLLLAVGGADDLRPRTGRARGPRPRVPRLHRARHPLGPGGQG